ncbi:aminoglycoside phosphotransferase family protein [Kitasatospora sp. NBC_01266]|uniref:aminoglycoside phosphotransferase family protein n=1 Tax=Kitasatospora sp. NBC_01266 TaxID=2903572 RepID=UPI002E329AFC|nr:aminoglycoside phosphotransferase family protein [Kitasatospora sp. NBC_01266]
MDESAFVAPEVRKRLAVRFGPEALDWCDRLPALVDQLTARWNLNVLEAGGGGTSRVFRCAQRADGATAWLKLTPDPEIAAAESQALHAWADTPSVVDLLAEDLAVGALLLQDVKPGIPMRQLDWTLPQVAALLRDLRIPSPSGGQGSALPPLAHRVDFLFEMTDRRLSTAGLSNAFDPAVLKRSRAAALELAGGDTVGLVHGDLHQANVLSGPGPSVVAIDPRPTLGDPDFDAVDWVMAGVAEVADLERRVEELAALVPGQSPDRVLAWCRALAVVDVAPRLCAGRDDTGTRFLVTLARS